MSDFSTELAERLQSSIKNNLKNDEDIAKLLSIIFNSSTYSDAYEYAFRYGEHFVSALNELEIEEWLFGTAMEVFEPSIMEMYSNIGDVCATIQINKNDADGLGLAPQIDVYDIYDTKSLVGNIVENPATLSQEITTFAEKIVDKTQKKNADFLLDSGLKIRVSREYDGVGLRRGTKSAENCAWCLERAGTRVFKNATQAGESGMFARHSGCNCSIDYRRL